jgi:hypothetical protein
MFLFYFCSALGILERTDTNISLNLTFRKSMAELTGLEPATFRVTGERSNQTELQLHCIFLYSKKEIYINIITKTNNFAQYFL